MASPKHRPRLYKQMALEVAVRNPERYQDFLTTFSKFEGQILNNDGILDIYVQLYLDGVVVSSNLSEEQQSNPIFLRNYIMDNNSHNNEWGFPTGYQAAFTRYLKTLSEFGFIYSQYNERLQLSPVAKAVVSKKITLSEAFALQSMRFWRKSPYRRVLNDFNYFSFVLSAITKLNALGRKMSQNQFLLSLFSDDGDIDSYIETINSNNFGNDEDLTYLYVLQHYSEVDALHAKVAKKSSSFNDYGNTVFRVLQLTGFITVEHSGVMLLSINKNRQEFLSKLKRFNFTISEEAKEDEKLYFEELGYFSMEMEHLIVAYREKEDLSTADYNKKIPAILESYALNKKILADYLIEVAQGKKDNRAFWFIQAPIKFELLITLFLYSCYGNEFAYKPNFKCDDVGIPYSHAPGNIGDIEIYNSFTHWLVEVTLIRSKNQQLNNETINLFRHLVEDTSRTQYMNLVAPYIHEDTDLMIKVGMVITLAENKKLSLFCKANDINSFVDGGLTNSNLSSTEMESKHFIISLKNYLNSIPETNLKYFSN